MAEPGGPRLGCGDHTVVIYDRCGQTQICELTPNTTALEYQRVIDDTSQAKATYNLTSETNSGEPCCECTGDLRSWIFSMAIFRNGSLAWGPGPLTNIIYKSQQVVITARDVTAWLDVRLIHNNYDFVQTSAVEVARVIITDALGAEDPCGILDYLIIEEPDDPILIDKVIEANTVKAGEVLRELARTVIDFTVVGLSIIVGQRLTYGPFGALTDENFQTELEVEERGIEAATKWFVKGDGVTGVAGGDDPYMGLIEDIVEEESLTSQSQADAGAVGRLEASNPPPVYINIPDGARLHPDAPIEFGNLIPGAIIDVALRDICRPIHQSNSLTQVRVTVDSTGNDSVQVSLAPEGINYSEGLEGF